LRAVLTGVSESYARAAEARANLLTPADLCTGILLQTRRKIDHPERFRALPEPQMTRRRLVSAWVRHDL
jgi:hypothetical protein